MVLIILFIILSAFVFGGLLQVHIRRLLIMHYLLRKHRNYQKIDPIPRSLFLKQIKIASYLAVICCSIGFGLITILIIDPSWRRLLYPPIVSFGIFAGLFEGIILTRIYIIESEQEE